MAIDDYEGNTFVAFLDISGFKVMMDDERRALRALDRFYQAGFWVLGNQNNVANGRVDGFFVSDSGILFVRYEREGGVEQLELIMRAVERINQKMLRKDFMLTTSIAYGHFSYHGRLEFRGIEKNPIYGDAYVHAFLDNENEKPKIQPGQCRIIKRGLPVTCENLSTRNQPSLFRKLKDNGKHYYFYWMVNSGEEIEDFERRYNDAYNLKYSGMLHALKRPEA